MSTTTAPPPFVETTPKTAIVASQTPLDMVNVVLSDPEVLAVFNKYAGNPDGLPASLAGLIVTGLVTHYGLQLPAATVLTLSTVVAAIFGYGWKWLSTKYLTPPTPVTQGVSP